MEKNTELSRAQKEALGHLARGVEQIKAQQARALEARGLAVITSGFTSPTGWVRATITEKGRELA